MQRLWNGLRLAAHGNIDYILFNIAKSLQMPSNLAPKPLRIAILAYPGCMGLEIFGVADLLLVANLVAKAMGKAPEQAFEVHVVGLQGRMVKAAGGIEIGIKRPRGVYDLLIVPGLEVSQSTQWHAKLASLQAELAYLRKSFARGMPVASVCVGTYLLAEAGLLADRHVTTAWIMAKDLAQRYPALRVSQDAVLLEDGAIITTGAISSSFDLTLHLIRRALGADIASATARIALLPKPRASQAPYVDAQLIAPPAESASASFSGHVVQWLQKRLAEPYSLERLAQAFHVSPRTLMRRVKLETGHSPLTLLQQERVKTAKHLLSTTTWSLEKIVETVGYSDVATFTRLFAREVRETPARYRRR
jgi:transcriptional regulator GlxA family with amidase domain